MDRLKNKKITALGALALSIGTAIGWALLWSRVVPF